MLIQEDVIFESQVKHPPMDRTRDGLNGDDIEASTT